MDQFLNGYDFFCKNFVANRSAIDNAQWINSVQQEIDTLFSDLNSFEGFKTDPSKLQGDIAEFFHAGTFNINSALNRSDHRAYVDRSHDFASPDISTNFGDKYGLKYYKDGAASAKAQAKSIFERYKEYQAKGGTDSLEKFLVDRGYDNIDTILNDPIYSGQMRLIPKGQLEDAIAWLEKKIAKESANRPDQVKRYEETLKLLRDRIRDNEGNESIPLSREDAEKLAKLAKEGKLNPEDLGLTTEQLVTYEYILKEAFKAGMSAATITMVLKVAPAIISAISYLVENGEVDSDDLKNIGFATISGAGEGFLRGSVSAALTASCKAGLLGTSLKSINPSVVGMTTVIVMDTIKNSFNVALGKMTRAELADELIKETYTASVSMAAGIALQMALPIPVFGFMLGSFVGSVIGGMTYSKGNDLALSFCTDTGFTMFGLVKQDYSLPDEILEDIGVDVFKIDEFKADEFKIDEFKIDKLHIDEFKVDSIRPYFLKRGVIGVKTIGYYVL